MTIISIEDAQSKLSELISGMMPGDEVIITDNGSSVARLTSIPQTQRRTPRQPGTLRGTVLYCAPDFDAPLNVFQEYMP